VPSGADDQAENLECLKGPLGAMRKGSQHEWADAIMKACEEELRRVEAEFEFLRVRHSWRSVCKRTESIARKGAGLGLKTAEGTADPFE